MFPGVTRVSGLLPAESPGGGEAGSRGPGLGAAGLGSGGQGESGGPEGDPGERGHREVTLTATGEERRRVKRGGVVERDHRKTEGRRNRRRRHGGERGRGFNPACASAASQAVQEELAARKEEVAEAVRNTQIFLQSKQASK